jgi:hypothetical protein
MDAQAVKTLTDLLLTTENLLIMIAAWFAIVIARKASPGVFRRPILVRLLPVLPTAITVGLIWVPGLRPDMPWGATLVLGIVLGWGAGQIHKVLAQTVLGRDDRIHGLKATAPRDPSEPESPPVDPPSIRPPGT